MGHHLRLFELLEIRGDIKENPLLCSRQSHPAEEENHQHEVWICGGEVNHLENARKPSARWPLQQIYGAFGKTCYK